ncbi:hypothetical protein NFI96_013359, partial [Prochilodus magdalenae]
TIDVTVNPHQYTYRRNRSTDDAISSVVHTALTHLEQKDSYVRMLFVDFTSAFTTMIPQTLTDKLSSLGLRSSLCNWVLDFLTNRPQSFADDTAVVGCITNSDESGYRQEVEHLEGWCRKNNLCINVKKTKEMIVDFRRGRHAHLPLHVRGSAQHFQPGQEGTSTALLPQAVEASCVRELGPHLLLQMCGGERPMLQHQRVARKLLCCRQESSAEGGEGCT